MFDPLESKILSEDMETVYRSRDTYEILRGKKIFITGAAGMIASYLIYFFLWLNEEKGFGIEIYAGVRKREKAFARFGIYAERPYFHIVVHDVVQPVPLDIGMDYILHAASFASPQYYGSNPVETMLPNVIGTNEIMRYACRFRPKSVLFFSSGTVYGTVAGKERIDEQSVGVIDHMAPGSVYGESKRCGEALCAAYCREYGVPVRIVRINHTYGPTLDLQGDKRAFSEFIRNILRGENIVLKSDGSEKRAFCYLSDAADALFRILLDGKDGECYNLVNETEFVGIGELAEILVGLFPEKDLHVIFEKRTDKGYVPLAQTSRVVCSMDKISAMGFLPRVDIREGFFRTIRYFMERGGNV